MDDAGRGSVARWAVDAQVSMVSGQQREELEDGLPLWYLGCKRVIC